MAKPGSVIGWTLDQQDRALPAPVRAAIVGRSDDD